VLPPFDKHQAYFAAVQEPEGDLQFGERRYREVFKKSPLVVGEDFCGTFALCCAWARKGGDRRAIGVDYAADPLVYGMKHIHSKLTEEQRRRVGIARSDVRSPHLPKADIVFALNYSYFIFKKRNDLRDYFLNAYRRLRPRGLFLLDCFGGPDCQKANVDVTRMPGGLTYYWEQYGFRHDTNEAKFAIHFQRRGEAKRLNVFQYDWRMWTVPELSELLTEAGFSRVDVYWETDGTYRRRKTDESDTTWLAYLVAVRE
jgi:SAM-dependent methyltransferase